MPEQPRPTLTDLARRARVSVATASYALRGSPEVSAETAARIRRLAAEIGYQPDLRVSSLMAHIRRRRPVSDRETMAFVWVSTFKGEAFPRYHRHYLDTILAGAKTRARQLGCELAEFWLDEPGMKPQRLAEILRARGITGVVFSPAMHDLAVRLDWPWEAFSCAIIGNTEWTPALHRAGHNHYRSMWRTLERLRGEGFIRPGAILNRSIQERIHGAHVAAFIANHPDPSAAPALVQLGLPETDGDLRPWSRRSASPDALIIGWPVDRNEAARLRPLAPQARRIVTLDWQPIGALPGMDVCNAEIAASAVDQVVAQLHRHDHGVPHHPTSLLLDGIWREEAAP